MTTRKSGSHRSGKTNATGNSRLRDSLRDKGRLRAKRRRQDRRSLLETLEQRQLLAGPQLIGIQPNEGSLLIDGTELNTAPRELVFQFDDAAEIDPESLAGIQITRAGDDNVFEAAEATSDLGTDGAVLVQFRAVETGISGNGIRLQFTTSSRTDSSVPLISVNGQTVSIDLNSNSSRTTTVRDLVQGLAAHREASELVSAIQVSGASQTRIGQTVPDGTEVVLTGANAAQAFTDLGTGNAVRVRVLATEAGSPGRGRQLIVEQRDFGGPALPVVLTEGRDVRVLVNSSSGNATTASELVTAVNENPQAGELLRLQLEAGDGDTTVGDRTPFYSPLTLRGASDVTLEPGFVGVGDSPNQVVFRFAEPLPDDIYQIDILGSGPTALQNIDGETFGDGVDLTRKFTLNLGPRVLAVVPEPVRRLADGSLNPEVGVIEVHFNDDELAVRRPIDPNGPTEPVAENPDFYQLFYSRNTASGDDDVLITPDSVDYDPVTNIARLQFADPLARVPDPDNPNQFLSGGARLRIGSDDALPTAPLAIDVPTTGVNPGDQFSTAFDLSGHISLGGTGTQSAVLSSEISNDTRYGLQFPGGPQMPGVRQIRPEDPTRLNRTVPLDHLRRGPDAVDGIDRVFYDFASSFLGNDPNTSGRDNDKTYVNVITEEQKQRVREVLQLFSEYLGIQFVETNGGPVDESFFTIAVGDLQGADAGATSGPGGLVAAAGDRNGDGFNDIGVLDFQDFDASTDDQFGGEFFRGAMLLVGQMLGYGYADDLPQPVTQSTLSVFNSGGVNEPTFPSAADIVNGQFLYRPESMDIDLYRFELSRSGTVSIQTIAERLSGSSLLDSALRLYKQQPDGNFEEIAANDDYFSNDSLIEMELGSGTYVVGVSSSGNTTYDPAIPGSGMGGRSEGAYDLRIDFRANIAGGLTDRTGVPLDGDADGSPGGIHNFWFAPSDPSATLYVDKATNSPGNGTINNPFANLDDAIAEAQPGETVRVVANGGLDGLVETNDDNFAYQIGVDSLGNRLPDGDSLDIPQDVTLVMDAGVIVKMQRSRIGVGSTSATIDRSGASLQLLGTPTLRDSNGQVVRDGNGEVIPGSVYFTSFNDDTIGTGNTPAFTRPPQPGDWGGLDFRGNLDAADENRTNHEANGLFLNHIQFADLRYGGGNVSVDGRSVVVSPVDMAVTRPTVVHSRITDSADAAIAATPDSFTETRFDETTFQADGLFTPDYHRVGPDIHGNFIVDNSINGLFVRVVTRSGDSLQPLTTQARFDDTDIPHILTENLVIQGHPGGPLLDSQAPAALLVRLAANANGAVPAGTYIYKLTNVDANGQESPASASTAPVTLANPGSISLSQLPAVPANSDFVGRRLYRAEVTIDPVSGERIEGPFRAVASLNSSRTSFTDDNTDPGAILVDRGVTLRARTNARLTIDPGTTIKLDSARIEAQFGAQLLAEGTADLPIVFTSLSDQRYGGSGTFDTDSQGPSAALAAGDWGGIYLGHTSKASFDHAVIAGAGGTTRIEGGFASFNPIEVHQAQVRLTNSVFEQNADGRGDPDGDRVGRMENAPGTIFVRGATPIIVGNRFTDGEGAAMSFDVNSLSSFAVSDWGRSRGPVDRVDPQGNAGPLIRNNALGNNEINGLHVRGGELATQGVWDDTDIVHVVTSTIEIPNQFAYGGLHLESDSRNSLVVKFEDRDEPAAIVVGGTLLTAEGQLRDIPDRIGGSLQVVGHPDFPVVLTSFKDDSAGAGFDPQGRPQVDTNNDGVTGAGGGPQAPASDFVVLPTGPEVNNGLLIDNDVARTTEGFFEVRPSPGGEIGLAANAQTASGTNTQLVSENLIFQFSNAVIVDGTTDVLANTTITQQPTLVADDRVESRGTFAGENGEVEWVATTYFLDGVPVMFNEISFESSEPLGDIRFVNYLDEDVQAPNDDFLYTTGTPGEADFRAFTIDSAERVGFAHGGFYENGDNQENATYVGWTADVFPSLRADIQANTASYSIPGVIDAAALGTGTDPDFGTIFGPADVTTAFAWDVDATATSSRITSFLELIPSDPAAGVAGQPAAGDWTGIVVREAASDRNVAAISEDEHDGALMPGTNSVPGRAQFLGELASDEGSGDENRRLGFVIDGSLAHRSDVDVYSFVAESGTQVWLDIDRTNLALDSVVELIDANGQILALSANSMAEELDRSKLIRSDRLDADAVRPLAEIGERTETQQLTISENIVDAEGFLTIGLEGSDETVPIPVENFVADPAGSLRLAVASRFGDQLGPIDVTLVRRDGRQVDPANPTNILAAGDNFVLEVRFNNDLFLGSDVPDLLVTTDALSVSGGGTVDVDLEEVIDPSKVQDLYSINPRDAGMRIVLPGETGARNLYHVRVRSSNVSPDASDAERDSKLTDPSLVRGGLTSGEYQLQIRLRELDESPGTQVRFADVRYATNGIQIIGQPFHSPLLGEEAEQAGPNGLFDEAQPLGAFGVGADGTVINSGPLNSDLLAKSIAGRLDSATDIDWYQFDVRYEDLTRDGSPLHLATIFDLDYADNFARADMALYVFDEAGRLIMLGTDSNISDDQPRSGQGADSTDLSRGSAGTLDPYIGTTELSEGSYFVAVANQSQIPLPMDQFYVANSANPLLRLEPIDSVVRIAEDRIGSSGGGTAADPEVPVLFDTSDSQVPLALNDLITYTIGSIGGSTEQTIQLINPFTGERYGEVGTIDQDIADFAFLPNGELFGYSRSLLDPSDTGWEYFRINSEDGSLTNLGPTSMQTFETEIVDGEREVVVSNDGVHPEAITFRDNTLGFFVGNRPAVPGPDYFDNILYQFDPQTGEPFSGPLGDREVRTFTVGGEEISIDDRVNGAGTQIRERGYIETRLVDIDGNVLNPQTTPRSQLIFPEATRVQTNGATTGILNDGYRFTITLSNGQPATFELNSGPAFTFRHEAANGISVRDGDLISVTSPSGTRVYEFNTGPVLVLDADALVDGSRVTLTDSNGESRTFEFDSNSSLSDPDAIRVSLFDRNGNRLDQQGQVSALVAAITAADFEVAAEASPGAELGRIQLKNDSETTPPTADGSGLTVEGDHDVNPGNEDTQIRVEENATRAQFAAAIAETVGNGVVVGFEGNRINFRGATSVDVNSLQTRGIITATIGNASVSGSAIEVPFSVSDRGEDVASRAALAINNAGFPNTSATSNGRTLILENGSVQRNQVNPAFQIPDLAPGGTVTGIATIGNVLYAVSNRGGLYRVGNPTNTVEGAIGDYVGSATDLLNIPFTGLSTGPPQAEGGRFANLLFGTTAAGRVYAFNTAGELQPVFSGGRTNIDVNGTGGVRGIQFSTLDYNLWHTTETRGRERGHGIEDTFSNTRVPNADWFFGGRSFYFGYEDDAFGRLTSDDQDPLQVPRQDGQDVARTFNFPGGAEGSLESNPFGLAGYAAADLPYLYFNYFLETQNSDGLNDLPDEAAAALDAFRVYVITDDGTEHLVATNNSARGPGLGDDEYDNPANNFRFADTFQDAPHREVQQLFDGTDSWRQARVPLAAFAGQDHLRLRIDFSTAGQIGRGDIGLRILAGDRLHDGQQIVIGNETFELTMGQKLIVPPGSSLAEFYAAADAGTPGSAPDTRVTIDVAGTTFVLNDGFRNFDPSANEVNVLLSDPADPNATPLAQLSAVEVAGILASVLEDNRPPTTVDDAFDFGVESNNELASATPLPDVAGDLSLSGSGELQSARDVDLFRIDALAGTVIEAAATRVSGSAVNPLVRLFDAEGNQLAITTSPAGFQFTVPSEGAYYIGYSSDQNNRYNPVVEGSGSDGNVGSYEASIDIRRDYRVLTVDNRIEITGGFAVTTPADSPLTIEGTLGSNGIPVRIDSTMSADEVAVALRNAVAKRFADGEQSVYPVNGSKVSLIGLTIRDPGPFGETGARWGDNFGAQGAGRARDNVFEGVYVDDFIIGFAERGELVTGADTTNTFIADPSPNLTSPPRPVSDLETGSYQLEIRDASEYVSSGSELSRQFRAFDTNTRFSLSQSIIARPATELVDGSTFTIGDGSASVTFEFDLVESNSGVAAGNARIPYTLDAIEPGSHTIDPLTGEPIPGTGIVRPQTADEVARAIVAAINSNEVQLVLNVSALPSSGVDATNDSQIELFGTSLIEDPTNALAAVVRSSGRGDKNRDRGAQGVILVENSRFIFSEQYGVDLVHDVTAEVAGVETENLVRYPRNLVELNTERLAPGVVVQSNVLAYNGAGGLRITGIDSGLTDASPVPFDRIVNNTIIGGSITPTDAATPETFQGIFFDLGATAFADQVVSYTPDAGGGPQPNATFRDPTRALGVPDGPGRGAEPTDGQSTVSLGHGGSIVLSFTDNLLTGSGDALPDLVVLETGAVESVRVEVSRDGVAFHNVGIVGGLTNVIDIDAAGFGPQDRFSFVRLTDLRQGTTGSPTIGADIDAVGAISSVATDRFTAGGTGVTVRQNAAPALLNNVVANSETGISVDASSGSTVLGGSTFYRNTNATSAGVSLGEFPQQLVDAEDVFVRPGDLVFTPSSGSAIIDSSINSLQDRASLVTVRSPLGLPPSPILAPAFDVNGQLRVDDPNVQSSLGSGETVFKDRGAADRADTSGPRAILVSPRAPEAGPEAGTAQVTGDAPRAFEIQLVDGIAPGDPVPGVGVDDRSVSSESLLLLKDGVPQIEGIDYRFGYNPSTNTIRLTALAGVFERNSAYVVRLLDDTDAVIRSVAGTQLDDGAIFNLVDRQGGVTRFEYETGIRVSLPTFDDTVDPDGITFAISDGPLELTFELDTDGTTAPGNVPIRPTTEVTPEAVLSLIASTINDTALQVTASVLDTGEIGLMGTRPLTAVDPLDSGATVTGTIGTSVGFGIGIPNNGLLADGVEDGQSFVIRRGAVEEVIFEFDTNGTLTDPDAVRVDIAGITTLEGIANAMVRAIGGAGLGLNPVNAGAGRVVLNGNANHSLDLTNSNLNQLELPGERATVPVVIPPASTAQEAAEIIAETIDAASLPGVGTSVVDTRIFVTGTRGITGTGAVELVTIQDTAGNRLQSNQPSGRTELTVFVGAGLDFGDAPAPYPTLLADNGPRHEIDSGLTLGAGVTSEADARIPNLDDDDGVSFRGPVRAGFNATLEVEVQSQNPVSSFILDIWVDWNGNGEFEGNQEVANDEYRHFASSIFIPQGSVFRGEIPLAVPADAVGTTYARVRLSSDGTDGPVGPAPDGEVIDLPVTVQANPFRNPDPDLRADVDGSGNVSPLDALLIINALNRANSLSIPLSPPPTVNLPPFPDVNGDGVVSAVDALEVINELNRLHSPAGSGEGESTAFVPDPRGVMASVPTVLGDLDPLGIPPLETESGGEGERASQDQPEIVSPKMVKATSFDGSSVFDSAQTIALDDVLESLTDRSIESAGDEETANVDSIFSEFGR